MNGTLNFRIIQPRMMTPKDAAIYVGLPLRRFPHTCPVAPVDLGGGVRLYDVQDLDRWVDAVKAGSLDPDDAILRLLDQEAPR